MRCSICSFCCRVQALVWLDCRAHMYDHCCFTLLALDQTVGQDSNCQEEGPSSLPPALQHMPSRSLGVLATCLKRACGSVFAHSVKCAVLCPRLSSAGLPNCKFCLFLRTLTMQLSGKVCLLGEAYSSIMLICMLCMACSSECPSPFMRY
jgi:hypothetical protein